MCIFCKIVEKTIPAKILFEDDELVAFHDVNPVAPVHVLVIPKTHIPTLDDLPPEAPALAAELFKAVQEVARCEGLSETGYRTVINCRGDGGQEVYHLHLHVLGGRKMRWPPG